MTTAFLLLDSTSIFKRKKWLCKWTDENMQKVTQKRISCSLFYNILDIPKKKQATIDGVPVAWKYMILIQWPFDKLVMWVVTWPLTCDCRNWQQQAVSRATKIILYSYTAIVETQAWGKFEDHTLGKSATLLNVYLWLLCGSSLRMVHGHIVPCYSVSYRFTLSSLWLNHSIYVLETLWVASLVAFENNFSNISGCELVNVFLICEKSWVFLITNLLQVLLQEALLQITLKKKLTQLIKNIKK